MSEFTPTQNMIRNIELFMTWRSLRHPDVARAMKTLGFPWHPKTVYRVLGGDRPIHLDEVYGLALVFETTVGALLDPATGERRSSAEAFKTGYKIELMDAIGLMEFRKLLEIPEDRLERAEVGVRSWVPEDFVDGVPQWKTWPLSSANQKLNAMIRATGWKNVDEVLAAHPAGFDVLMDLISFIEEHPKSREGAAVD